MSRAFTGLQLRPAASIAPKADEESLVVAVLRTNSVFGLSMFASVTLSPGLVRM